MAAPLVCWKCGASLRALPLPLSRTAECPQCKAELHACRMCRFFAPHTTRQCAEIRAEEVVKKDQANYCDWFKPRPDAFDPRAEAKAASAKSKLDALFGEAPPDTDAKDPAHEAAERLFPDKKKPS